MMTLFMNAFILLKPSHLEMKISGTLECCKIKGKASKLSVGWYVGSTLRHFSQHLKHTEFFAPVTRLPFPPVFCSWADMLSKEVWVPQTCLERDARCSKLWQYS